MRALPLTLSLERQRPPCPVAEKSVASAKGMLVHMSMQSPFAGRTVSATSCSCGFIIIVAMRACADEDGGGQRKGPPRPERASP